MERYHIGGPSVYLGLGARRVRATSAVAARATHRAIARKSRGPAVRAAEIHTGSAVIAKTRVKIPLRRW